MNRIRGPEPQCFFAEVCRNRHTSGRLAARLLLCADPFEDLRLTVQLKDAMVTTASRPAAGRSLQPWRVSSNCDVRFDGVGTLAAALSHWRRREPAPTNRRGTVAALPRITSTAGKATCHRIYCVILTTNRSARAWFARTHSLPASRGLRAEGRGRSSRRLAPHKSTWDGARGRINMAGQIIGLTTGREDGMAAIYWCKPI
jgi:hypothetical protein